MFSKFATRIALMAAGTIGIAGLSHAASASVLFNNLTSQDLRFTTACAKDTSTQEWVVDPHARGALYCRNGSDEMQVTIRTQRSNGTVEVVRSTVFDGRAYDLGYDDDGDVSIARRG